MAEGIEGGFAAVYPVLRALEEAGRIRRGYFVDGLGAAQFALAGAIDRLRAVRDAADPPAAGAIHLLAAADPANPYGAALAWPRRGDDDRRPFQRAAGAYVVLSTGWRSSTWSVAAASLQTFPAADDPDVALAAARPSATLVGDGRLRELVIRKVDGDDVGDVPVPADACSRPASCPATGASCSVPIARGVPVRSPPWGPASRAAECPRATRSSGPRPGCGRTSSGARSRPLGPRGPGPVPRLDRIVGHDGHRGRRAAARTC